jgi:hypothetical protein
MSRLCAAKHGVSGWCGRWRWSWRADRRDGQRASAPAFLDTPMTDRIDNIVEKTG